jgi:hypothetical protein
MTRDIIEIEQVIMEREEKAVEYKEVIVEDAVEVVRWCYCNTINNNENRSNNNNSNKNNDNKLRWNMWNAKK